MIAERPQDVRIVKPDGSTIICELAFAGFDDGMAVWEIHPDSRVNFTQGDQLWFGFLPPRTTILIPSDDFEGEL